MTWTCPATGGPHDFAQESDDANGAYVRCSECQAGEKLPVRRRSSPLRRPRSAFDQPDEWSLR